MTHSRYILDSPSLFGTVSTVFPSRNEFLHNQGFSALIGKLLTNASVSAGVSQGRLSKIQATHLVVRYFEDVLILLVGKVEVEDLFRGGNFEDLGLIRRNDRAISASKLSSSILVISASKWKTSQQPINTGFVIGVKVDDGENGYQDRKSHTLFGDRT